MNRHFLKDPFSPRVSIIIPVFNGANYLRKSLESALSQSYLNTEVIVINDGSTDNGETETIALSYNDKIRYFNQRHCGVATALNRGILESTGEYISWLSHDDIYFPNKVQTQISYLAKFMQRDNILLYSDFIYIDEQSRFLRAHRIKGVNETKFILSLFSGGILNGCTLLIPKSCFIKAGLFNEKLLTTQDTELWFRLIKLQYRFIHLPNILLKSRIHDKMSTISMADICYQERELLFKWALDYFEKDLNESSLIKIEQYLKREGLDSASQYANRIRYMKRNVSTSLRYIPFPTSEY